METKTIYVVGGRTFADQNYYDTRERAYRDEDMQHELGDEIIEFAEVARFKLKDKGNADGLEIIDNEFIDALTKVCEYMDESERKHFEEADEPKDHIFRAVRTLMFFLEDIKK